MAAREPKSGQSAAAPTAAIDLPRTLIGKTEREVVELLGEPDDMEWMELVELDDATDEERRRWTDEMKRTATSIYTYPSRNLAVLFNPWDQVIAIKPLDQEEPRTGRRID